jgi:aldose sugar dehydrogenase
MAGRTAGILLKRRVFLVLIAICTAFEGGVAQDTEPEKIATEYQLIELIQIEKELENPWSVGFLPEGEILVTERPGRLLLLSNESRVEVSGLPEVYAHGQGGLLDIAVHPDFSNNQLIYMAYSFGSADGTVLKLARGRLVNTELQGVEEIFHSNDKVTPGGHYGSRIAFLKDGTLLLTLGDRGFQPGSAQDKQKHSGKIIRLNEDGSIPHDNPFIDNPEFASEIFSYGHRNPQGIVQHPDTGEIWSTEHGPRGGDELNLIKPGTNYGWPVVSLGRDYFSQGAQGKRSKQGMQDPVLEFLPTLAPSGLAVISGGGFHNTWQGNLLAGGLSSERLLRIVIENSEVVHVEEIINGELGRIRDVRQGPDGAIYVATDSSTGGIFRLSPTYDENTLVGKMRNDGRFGMFTNLIEQTPLNQVLSSNEGNFTIFAPTDEAFHQLPENVLKEWKNDPSEMIGIIVRHITMGSVSLAELMGMAEIATGQGQVLTIELRDETVYLNGVSVDDAYINASNGKIFPVNTLLISPPIGDN